MTLPPLQKKINDYFLSVGNNLLQHFCSQNNIYKFFLTQKINPMFLPHVNEEDVLLAISNLKSSTAWGFDEILSKLLKKCVRHVLVPLTY